MKRIQLVFALIVLLLSQVALAQSGPAKVAFLSFGTSPTPWSVTEKTIISELFHGGFLSEAEFAATDSRGDIAGENVTILALDAGWELNQLGIMVETALDREADVLVAFTTPVAQAAINATQDMDDPPAVLFASVRHPYVAGLADASCIKPSHVSGIELLAPYEQLVGLAQQQQPEISSIGVIFSADQIAGAEGARIITEAGDALGITVLQGAVTRPIDFIAAVDGMVSRGAEAIIPTIDTVTSRGLNAIVSTSGESLLPVYYPSLGGISNGAMISAGTFKHVEQGVKIGRMVSAYLRGELDIATTAIDAIGGDGIGVNLAVAEELGFTIDPELLGAADLVFSPEGIKLSERLEASYASDDELQMTGDDADAARAYLDSLRCSDEMIAEQKGKLETQESE